MSEKTGQKPTSPSRIGDLAEHYAITYLWDKGYHVFKNCGCTGPIDIIAIDSEGKIKLIDVKCISKRENGSMVYRILSDNQRSFEEKTGQKIDIVYADTDTYEVKYSSRREKRKKVA